MIPSLPRRALLAGALAVAGLAASLVPAAADALSDIKARGTIRIGLFEDFPPFASMNSSMKIEGYDTEVADKLASALGVKAELVGVTGQNRIPNLTEGKIDMLLSIGFSDERAQVVEFTDPYAPYYIAVLGPKDLDVADAAAMAGKTVAVNRGTLEDTSLTEAAPKDATIQRYGDYAGVISAFLSGQAQLMAVGNDVGATILAQNPKIEPVEKFQLMSSPSRMGVKKGEVALRDALNETLKGMKADGSLNALAEKWLKKPLAADF